ncbi:MAG: ornithine cyclodeaminase family protein, partial [Thaumarchaeota archaeon]|nr:ornithine cyclodeaminase family protein [Nitrososphaerota archaeon]
ITFESFRCRRMDKVQFISDEDVRAVLKIPDAIQVIEDALRDCSGEAAKVIPRFAIRTPNGTYRTMAASVPGMNVVGSKQGFFTSPDPKSDKQSVMSGELTSLYDIKSGALLALVNSHYLNEARTGASAAVGTKYLSNPDSKNLGIIGSGLQAKTQLIAHCCVRKIEKVKVYSRRKERRESFCESVRSLVNVNEIVPVSSPEEACQDSDIVVEATSSTTPVFDGKSLKQGTHVTAIGTGIRGARTLDDVSVHRASVFALGSKEQALIDGLGDVFHPIMSGFLEWSKVVEIGDVVCGKVPGRQSSKDITLFKSNGSALYDVAVGKLVYDSLTRSKS